jgi:hypothetical protein
MGEPVTIEDLAEATGRTAEQLRHAWASQVHFFASPAPLNRGWTSTRKPPSCPSVRRSPSADR